MNAGTVSNRQERDMIDVKMLDEFTRRISAAIPGGARELQEDVEKNVRAALSAAFARLDLVTREEFDVQKALLERTRMKLEELDRRLAELEGERQAGL